MRHVDVGRAAGEGKSFRMTWGWAQADGTVGTLEVCIGQGPRAR